MGGYGAPANYYSRLVVVVGEGKAALARAPCSRTWSWWWRLTVCSDGVPADGEGVGGGGDGGWGGQKRPSKIRPWGGVGAHVDGSRAVTHLWRSLWRRSQRDATARALSATALGRVVVLTVSGSEGGPVGRESVLALVAEAVASSDGAPAKKKEVVVIGGGG